MISPGVFTWFGSLILKQLKLIYTMPWSFHNSWERLYRTQKQPPEVFEKKRCAYKFRKIYNKTPVLGSDFNKIYQKDLLTQVFSGEICENFKTPILKNICEGLFLRILQVELLNSTSRFFYFNESLRTFEFSCLGSIS